MKTPDFWYRPAGPAAWALAPLGLVYGLAVRHRLATGRPGRVGVPVVCVGNLVAGGAGKTPVTLAVAAALEARGLAVHTLIRGHGGHERGPLRVDPAHHDSHAVGDEALLLAGRFPCWVARDRLAGAKMAAAAGAGAIVMDDGFQNPGLAKDLSLVVVDGAVGFGNGCIVPAGPLREPVSRGLRRADALVVLGEDRAGVAEDAGRRAPGLPVLHARLEPDTDSRALAGRRVLAFAGIGRPAKFFTTLEEIGAHVVERIGFADHHPYARDEVVTLLDRAAGLGALLVTTAKDAVRLPPDLRDQLTVVQVGVAWQDPPALNRLLDRLPPAGGPHGEAA